MQEFYPKIQKNNAVCLEASQRIFMSFGVKLQIAA